MPNIQYFLGANSPQGFYSLYDQLIRPEQANAVYILKGGPGCGKSTLMRQVAGTAKEKGCPVEYILCSGDPDSLDAVVLPTLGTALVDGTSPHVVEPRCPGAVDRYVNLGDCYDHTSLVPLRQAITDCIRDNKNCYRRCTRCLAAAAQLEAEGRSILLTDSVLIRLDKRAEGILSRELPRRKACTPGQVRQRFLSAVTHLGRMTLYDTARAQCERIYDLSDRCGFAHHMLSTLLTRITAAGYDVTACPSPMAPDRLEHLLVPELGLAFLSTAPGDELGFRPYRRLHLDSMAEPGLLRHSRPRLRFARKVISSLTDEAVDALAQAKAVHDRLEALYHPHVDFDRVEHMARDICTHLFP